MSEQYGMFRIKPYHARLDDKVWKIFEKLKRKAELANVGKFRSDPRLGEYDNDQHLQQLSRDAMKSLHLLPEVQKTDEGFHVSGDNGLDPDG